MNILLYSPALLAIFITQLGYDFHENDIHIYQRWYSRWNKMKPNFIYAERTIYNWKSFQSPWRLGSDWRLCPGILSLSSLQKYSNLEDLVILGLELEPDNIAALAFHSSGAAGPSWSFSLPRPCCLLLWRLQLLQDFHAQVCQLSKSVSWLLFICQCGNLL